MMDANLPATSVILPVHNGGKYLRAAIDSVLAQKGVQFELIVVDGNSTDDTQVIAESFGTRIRYFRTGPDNVSLARNLGIANSRHPLIAFMSTDDFWLEQKLVKQAGWLASNPGAAICVCLVRHFLEEGCRWPANFREHLREGESVCFIPETFLSRREVFDRIGLFDPSLKTAEDVDWFARARDAGEQIGVVQETLLHKRVHDSNLSLTLPGMHGDILRALRGSIRRKGGAS